MELNKNDIIKYKCSTGCPKMGLKEYLFETPMGKFVGYGRSKKEAMMSAEPLWLPAGVPCLAGRN